MNRKIKIFVISVLVLLNFACQPNQAILNSKRKTPAASANSVERPPDTFETALRGVQKSGFDYIFVIRRKDGEVFDKDDKVFIRENSPAETNQFVLTDEDRVIIAGSNYPFPEDILGFLRERFNIEDLSPKKAEDANSNLNKEANADSNKTNGNSNK